VKLVLGLGNPGEYYRLTRHNIGFLIIERIAQEYKLQISQNRFHSIIGEGSINGKRVVIAKPLTYMNLCGKAARKLLAHFKMDTKGLIVVHDDLDMEFGKIKIKEKGGHGGHNGVGSIITALGVKEFTRLKVGIGRPNNNRGVTDYVLSSFNSEQLDVLPDLIDLAGRAIVSLITRGVRVSMNEFNRQTCKVE